MYSFFRFIASAQGRVVRIFAGLGLIVLGLRAIKSTAGSIVLGVIGMVPLLAGIFDLCVFAPLFHLPFVGDRLRSEVKLD